MVVVKCLGGGMMVVVGKEVGQEGEVLQGSGQVLELIFCWLASLFDLSHSGTVPCLLLGEFRLPVHTGNLTQYIELVFSELLSFASWYGQM